MGLSLGIRRGQGLFRVVDLEGERGVGMNELNRAESGPLYTHRVNCIININQCIQIGCSAA